MSANSRVVLAVVMVFVCCVLGASASWAAPDDGLACELVSLSAVEKTFGLPHAVFRLKATSPTASEPNNHTVDGSDQSECDVYVYGASPTVAELAGIVHSPGRPNVPAGIGSVIVTTNVRDDTNAGDSGARWKPFTFFSRLAQAEWGDLMLEFGGKAISVPNYGGYEDSGWIGNTNHAVGIWQVGGGVITINVFAAGGTAPSKLGALAKIIVPKFVPFAGP